MSKSRNSSIVMPVDADVVLLPTRGAPPDSGSFASIRCGAGGDESLNFTDGNDECIEVITSDSGTNTGGSASRRDSITEAVVKVEAVCSKDLVRSLTDRNLRLQSRESRQNHTMAFFAKCVVT